MSGPLPEFDLDAFMPYLLARLAEGVSGDFARIYGAAHGITIPEWRVLAHLSQQDAVSVREIHVRAGMDKAKISRAAARLVSAGLVSKRAGADRRLVSLSLTGEGRGLMARLAPLALDFQRDLLSALSPAEAAQLRALVGKLIAARATRRTVHPDA